ncbi:MAG: T9SS type A sorting domain-containing protein [Prevotella sp.]|nr:T9SS type A sorting domain-containing protein [Prevotella sp.]MCF0208390.1 T9SS type A sorting domain-containing protein [Bacteroidaceae bacterium]
MRKLILILSIFALSATVVPTSANAAIDIIDMNSAEISVIQSNNSVLHVENAQNAVLRVYDVTGVAVITIKITSASQKVDISGLQKGCYIVKVGNVTRKISISK